MISSIIFKQLSEDKFSFYKFYSRRIRRIYPVLILVLLYVLVFGFVYFSSNEYKSLGRHAFGGSFFSTNLLLLKEAGYFDESSTEKPLLHLWSLGIEEQFYIVWPITLYLIYKVKKSLLLPVAIIGLVVSFLFNVIFVENHQTAVFFSPVSRFWELLSGAILAYISINYRNIFEEITKKINSKIETSFIKIFKVENILSVAGILLFLISLCCVTGDIFPGFFALLPVLSCICLIASGTKATFNKYILSNKIVVFIGLISYPLYLWHWPFISLYYIIIGHEPSLAYAIVIAPIVIILSWLTTVFIERPFRFGEHGFIKSVILFLLICAIGFTGFYIWYKDGCISKWNAAIESSEGSHQVLGLYSKNKLTVDLNNCEFNNVWNKETMQCASSNPSALQKIALIGDSHIGQYYYSLKKLIPSNISLDVYAVGASAPFIDIRSGFWSESRKQNVDLINLSYKKVLSDSKFSIIILGHWFDSVNGWCEDLQNPKSKDWRENLKNGMKRTFDALKKANKKVFFIIDTPVLDVQPNSLINRTYPFNHNFYKMSVVNYKKSFANKKYIPILKKIAKNYDNITLIDLPNYLCDDQFCKVMEDGKPIFINSTLSPISPISSLDKYNYHTSFFGADYLSKYIYSFIKFDIEKIDN